jgi:hypothetical protein
LGNGKAGKRGWKPEDLPGSKSRVKPTGCWAPARPADKKGNPGTELFQPGIFVFKQHVVATPKLNVELKTVNRIL